MIKLRSFIVFQGVHAYRYAFVVFVSEGIFSHFSRIGQSALCLRCGFLTVTYAILHAHFVYRYLILNRSTLIQRYFIPYGLILTFLYCFAHMMLWTAVCVLFFDGDLERKAYVHDSFKELYNLESYDFNMVIALYREGEERTITKNLKSRVNMSVKTLHLQKQLFKALTVQTLIPMCVSLIPCMAVWFGPLFLLDVRCVYLASCIAASVFPCIDPIAIILFLPSLRRRFYSTGALPTSSVSFKIS
uniref:G protein-coupled receptor n=1 Tax=Caenorhabditis tropicalis TaxID=1561998 RepID=A0A1I7UBV8_9PELO